MLTLKQGMNLVLLAGLALPAGGCAAAAVLPPVAIAAGVEGMSLNQTGKTGSDHLASLVTGEDCSILRYTHTGKYCLTDAEVAAQEAALHKPYFGTCYRLRSGVTCYDQPDPTHSSETNVYQP
ncbi:MAG TPA: hypothetical protein VGM59_07450 [Dongiaceae bacterium]|jgi:hypothetical protein